MSTCSRRPSAARRTLWPTAGRPPSPSPHADCIRNLTSAIRPASRPAPLASICSPSVRRKEIQERKTFREKLQNLAEQTPNGRKQDGNMRRKTKELKTENCCMKNMNQKDQ